MMSYQASQDLLVRHSGLLWYLFAMDTVPVVRSNFNFVEQCLAGHAEIAACIVGRDAALVRPKYVNSRPIDAGGHVGPSQQRVRRTRRRPACKSEEEAAPRRQRLLCVRHDMLGHGPCERLLIANHVNSPHRSRLRLLRHCKQCCILTFTGAARWFAQCRMQGR